MDTMLRRLLTALFFLFLILVIWWLWNMDKSEKTKVDDIVTTEPIKLTESKPIKFKPKKRRLTVPVEAEKFEKELEVEVRSDENGVFITKIGDRDVEKQVSHMPVERLKVMDGIMTFWEVNNETGKLKFQSLNLGAFIDQVLEAK